MVLLPAVLAALVVPLGSAQADEAASEIITTSGPIGAKTPDLAELRKPGAWDRYLKKAAAAEAQPMVPHETVGPARSGAPRSPEESAVPPARQDPVSAPQVSLPEPSHTMSKVECLEGLGSKEFFIKSRFAVCSGREFTNTWFTNREPLGVSHFTVLAIGTIAKNSRTMTVTYHFVGFNATGRQNAAGLGITTRAKIAQSWPSTAKYKLGGTALPLKKTWSQLVALGSFKHTVYAAADQGSSGSTDTIFAAYQPNIKLSPPPGWTIGLPSDSDIFMLPPRWDKATYLPNRAKGAAVFSMVTALKLSTKPSAPEWDVAKHIKLAYTNPGATKPPYSGKELPGNSANAPLTRLHKDATRRKENRNRAIYNCKKYYGADYTEGGRKECDEFPMATAYEGAAMSKYDPRAHPKNFSAKPVDEKANGAAGNLSAQYYDKNRILDGPDDGFLVKITS
ncbi:hypothetical protein [Streptomyces sp. NPDC055243]|uniref:hypothetical protein n=1 Tax=Streptomyces sp. NPDC055243 TaxID=3365720 RepID=UPI0037CE96D7